MAPPINPQILAALMQQGGQQQGPLPPTNPVQPQAGVPLPGTGMAAQGGSPMPPQQPLDPQQIGAQAMQQGMQQTTQQLNRANTLSDRAMRLSGQRYETADPTYGFQPNFEHGKGVGGFFHNLGQALLTLGAATAPGQAVQGVIYGPDIRARQAEIASRAAEIGTIEKGAEQAEQATGPLAKMGPAYMGAEARGIIAQAATDRVKAYTQSVQDRAKNYTATADWHSASLDEKKRANLVNEAQRQADEAGRDFRSLHKDATTEEVAQIVTGTREQIANQAAARDPSVKSWLFNALGVSVPQVQGAPSPEFRETPKANAPQTSPKPQAKTSGGKKGVWNSKTGQVDWK